MKDLHVDVTKNDWNFRFSETYGHDLVSSHDVVPLP
jgi:hypothetical protein